jgi:hypothetical protein
MAIVDVHGWIVVLMVRRHTMSLAAGPGLDEPLYRYMFPERLEYAHGGGSCWFAAIM